MDGCMLAHEAFVFVMNKYKITPQELVNISGVDKGVVSRFLNGISDIKASNLQKLITALPPDARTHFNMLFTFSNGTVAEKSNEYKIT